MTRSSRNRPAACGKQPHRPKRLVRWTLGDEDILIEMWLSNRSCEQISERLERTPNAITAKAAKLALPLRDGAADAASAEAAVRAFRERRIVNRRPRIRQPAGTGASAVRPPTAKARGRAMREGLWSLEEERILMEMWMRNLSNEEISERLGRGTVAIAVKASRLNMPRRNRYDDHPKAGIRRCLCCKRDFLSSGPGNRICRPCKDCKEYEGVVEHKCAYLP